MSIRRSPFSLIRAHGAGNTFWLTTRDVALEDRVSLVQKVCNAWGVSTDGFVFLNRKDAGSVVWDFYNSDGSSAELCGNAARCVAAFLNYLNPELPGFNLETRAGRVMLAVEDPDIGVFSAVLPVATVLSPQFTVEVGRRKVTGAWIRAGVPHYVIPSEPNFELASLLRSHSAFGAEGANVTFVQGDQLDWLSAQTFERGVEDFTLACGTGAVAAATWARCQNGVFSNVWVSMPGGILEVTWVGKQQSPKLTGLGELEFEIYPFEEGSL